MNIENAKYVQDITIQSEKKSIVATIDGIQLAVPMDPTNRHYDEIMRQVEAGTLTIEEAESE